MKHLVISAALSALAMFLMCIGTANASEIHDAVWISDMAKIEALIKANPDCVKEYNGYGQTPLLMHVTPDGNIDVIKLLLENKADPNTTMKASPKCTPLHMACQYGLLDIVELLLEKGADPRCRVHPYGNGETPIFIAAANNRSAIVKRLLDFGINVNDKEQGLTIFHHAARCGSVNVIRMLLDRKIDPNIPDVNNSTPLHYAAGWGNEELVKLLLEHGANIEARDSEGLTPLIIAAKCNQDKMVRFLIEKGAKLDIKGKSGESALLMLFKSNITEQIPYAMNHGTPEFTGEPVDVELITAQSVIKATTE